MSLFCGADEPAIKVPEDGSASFSMGQFKDGTAWLSVKIARDENAGVRFRIDQVHQRYA